jgi:hypothetical protein
MSSGKTKRKPKRASGRRERRPRTEVTPAEGGSEEAANFIAETVASLAKLARRHELDMLTYLLAMTQLEAEEQAMLLRRRKLS